MENPENQNKQENQNQSHNFFPLSRPNPIKLSQNPISYLPNFNSEEQAKNNIFIQKRNRMGETNGENSNKSEMISEQDNKNGENNDTSSDINIKSLHLQKNKIYPMNQLNSHDQFICKKMSIDLDDDINNSISGNKKLNTCNCKNSGCLKRYCECFSKMKFCDVNCQCKNCLNNIKNEKERNEAIRLYLIKSPVSFKKMNMDLNNVTCNCKKSNCLKNYCECYQFGLKCTYNCGCVDCKNRNTFEKKLFFVENNCDSKKNNQNNNNVIIDKQKNEINNQGQLDKNNNDSNNNKIDINNMDKTENMKKNINNPQFIVNKNVNDIINNNISQLNIKNRARFLSFDENMSQCSQWNNLNLKTIEISNKKVIIDNYNVNQPEDLGYSFPENLFNNYNNTTNIFNNSTNNNNNIIITRKNSAFSAIIK